MVSPRPILARPRMLAAEIHSPHLSTSLHSFRRLVNSRFNYSLVARSSPKSRAFGDVSGISVHLRLTVEVVAVALARQSGLSRAFGARCARAL